MKGWAFPGGFMFFPLDPLRRVLQRSLMTTQNNTAQLTPIGVLLKGADC